MMAKKSTVLISFLLLLIFGVFSFIFTQSELRYIEHPWYNNIDIEQQQEDRDRLRGSAIVKKNSSAARVNVGRILAKYDAESRERSERDSATPVHLTTIENSRPSEPGEESIKIHLFELNKTPPFLSQKNLDTLSHLKTTELRLDKAKTELWLYLKEQFKTIHFTDESTTDSELRKTNLLDSLKEQLDLLSFHASGLQDIVDSLIDEGWREKMSKDLSNLIQKRLYHLQNPKNCNETKKLLCPVSKPCGFGCQMHHVAYCFIFAYATERMLILDANNWKYASKWEKAFEPLVGSSDCIQELQDSVGAHWSTYNEDTPPLIIKLPSIDTIGSNKKPSFLPMAVPSDIIDKLKTFHGYPFVWFIGQFLHYLMRPSQQLKQYLDERRAHFNITHPIVGVHIRRTDKLIKEASYHSIEEYMTEVEEWYDWRRTVLGREGEIKRVYLASDDATVLNATIKMYPDYVFVSDQDVSKTAGDLKRRYSEDSLYGAVLDLLMLSECDYIVCTLSSQMCRLAYELMQKHHTDASRLVYSLDDVYYYGGQQEHFVKSFHHTRTNQAVEQEENKKGREEGMREIKTVRGRTKEMPSKVYKNHKISEGDLIKIAGNHHNGFSLGKKIHSDYKALFPSYIVEEETLVADFPKYPQVI